PATASAPVRPLSAAWLRSRRPLRPFTLARVPRRLLLAAAQFGSERVARGARSQHPPDHHAYEQDRRDEDEVAGGHRLVVFCASVCISASTLPSRRQIVQR